jgi:lipopolysaccharide transport system ATP-binding protein
MSDIAIRIENLGKLYHIGERQGYKTLREAITNIFTAPLRKFKEAAKSKDEALNYIWALKNISFEINKGEVVGIIGGNGAGKTTLLKILSRITPPTEGYAEVCGRVGSLLEVGTGFHPELTGRDNIYLNGAILGMEKQELNRKFDEIVAFAELEKFIDTPVKHYSSGMYVRLAFAVAAHLEPEILLIDEVLAVGDAAFQKKCLGKMGDVAREGRTVVLISHNMPSIINLCQRALLLTAGRLEKEGHPNDVVQHYLDTVRSASGQIVWPEAAKAPGNDIVRLQAVRILQEGIDGPAADIDISKEVVIEISYWNLKDGALLYTAIWLRDQIGTVVFSTANTTSVSLTDDPWYGRPQPKGLFQATCRIPGNFLNEGLYSVTAIVGRGAADTQILQDYAISFHVHDTGQMRKEYFGGWIGIVRPRLAWETKYTG